MWLNGNEFSWNNDCDIPLIHRCLDRINIIRNRLVKGGKMSMFIGDIKAPIAEILFGKMSGKSGIQFVVQGYEKTPSDVWKEIKRIMYPHHAGYLVEIKKSKRRKKQ